ncbi:hypothetical protein HGT72_05010 [Rosenbergiella nectarea subsp. apis]|nr:hypothetical protein [Rosenbergiella nectarea subsp. apis]
MNKRDLYKKGLYSCPIPSGDTSNWNVARWIDYIDLYGLWGQ